MMQALDIGNEQYKMCDGRVSAEFRFDIQFTANDRTNANGFSGSQKSRDAAQRIVVGDGKCRTALPFLLQQELHRAAGSVQQAVMCMAMQLHILHRKPPLVTMAYFYNHRPKSFLLPCFGRFFIS